MSGETNLELLLRSMEPVLREGTFVFAHVPQADVVVAKQHCISGSPATRHNDNKRHGGRRENNGFI